MSEPKRSGPIRRRVNSRRNSSCALPLDRLDWSNWWTDRMQILGTDFIQDDFATSTKDVVHHFTYLHVVADNKTVQRVFCKHADNPRVAFRNGQLYWLIDKPCISDGFIAPNARIKVYNGVFGDVSFIDYSTVF